MEDRTDTHDAPSGQASAPGWRPLRLPSRRASTVLASVMLGLGIAVGAAIGPAPEISLAGDGASQVAKRLPLLIAELELRQSESAATASAASKPASPATKEANSSETSSASEAAASSSGTSSSKEEENAESESGKEESGKQKSATKKALPPVTSVWLIELNGSGFSAALAAPSSAPTVTQTVAQGTLLSGWSALAGATFAGDAALAEPPTSTGVPPLLHTIVEPACPEGDTACAPETPGALTTADEFLKLVLATITGTPAYKEHGLVAITYATVGLAAQSGLPEGASSATLTYQPPAGVLLLSPFAKAGRSSVAFNATSPRQSLEKLLHG